jgi:hypothetical protein
MLKHQVAIAAENAARKIATLPKPRSPRISGQPFSSARW